MKRIFVILLLCLSFIIVGCKKEEKESGDINYKKNVDSLYNEVSYDIDGYHLELKSKYRGMSYNDSLFSYMINDNNGMFIVEYKGITKNIKIEDYQGYLLNEKTYLYKLNSDVIDIYYVIDDTNYLYISIENLNNEFNEDTINFLFNQLTFEVSI